MFGRFTLFNNVLACTPSLIQKKINVFFIYLCLSLLAYSLDQCVSYDKCLYLGYHRNVP